MKTMLAVLLVVALNVGVEEGAPSAAEQRRMYMEAVGLNQRGQFAEAEAQLKKLEMLRPDDVKVKELLAEVQAKWKAQQAEPLNVLKRKLAETIVAEVKYREAAAQDVIQHLEETTKVNFVWLVPADVKVAPVTLSLTKTPLKDVLQYVTQLSGLKYRVEPHAVVIYKAEASNAKTE